VADIGICEQIFAMATEVELLPLDTTTFSTKRKRGDNIIVDNFGKTLGSKPNHLSFHAKKHLKFTPPSKIFTMKEIGLEDVGISPVAVSEPFPLFSEEAIQQIRAEVLSEDVWTNCQYSSNLAQCQLRGFCPE
jgi:hypothetical protein